jgi:diguanylate cyclase (GGDEF)-like protein
MTELLDATTLFVLTALFSGLITVVFFAIHRGVHGVVSGVLSFAWAYGFFTLFATLLLLRGFVHPVFSVVIADTGLSLALLMIADGVCRLANQPVNSLFYRWYLTFCLLAFSWFTLIMPSFTGRILVNVVSIVLVFGWILQILWRRGIANWRLGEWILAVSLLVSVLAALGRAVLLQQMPALPADVSILSYHGPQSHYLMVNLLCTVFIAFGLIVMTQDRLKSDLERLASYDALTGVLTRRVILNLLDKSLAKVARTGRPLAVMMLDLDHFKRINDKYGHRMGDRVLADVISTVESALRKDTYIGRYGGEEFLVLMPDTSYEQLQEVSDRIRHVVAASPISLQAESINCTISIGALIIDSRSVESLQDPVTLADKALYQAKVQGRNQVVIAQSTSSIPVVHN